VSALLLAGLVAGGAAGAFVGRLLRVPMWPLTGALVGSALVHLAVGGGAVMPTWCVFAAQVLVGSTLGARLGPGVVREFLDVVVPGLVAVLLTVAAGVGLGLVMWSGHRVGLVEAVFGMVPGGLGEMVAAVAGQNGDSALVAGMHVVRVLVVITVMDRVVRWLRRRDGSDPVAD
jgi:uncharacterized protein